MVLAGYLVWIRSNLVPTVTPQYQEILVPTISLTPTLAASPSASPTPEKEKAATPTARPE